MRDARYSTRYAAALRVWQDNAARSAGAGVLRRHATFAATRLLIILYRRRAMIIGAICATYVRLPPFTAALALYAGYDIATPYVDGHELLRDAADI